VRLPGGLRSPGPGCFGSQGTRVLTPRFLMYDFLADRKWSILGVWAAPGGRETFQNGGGLRPPPFWKVSRPPGAAQSPEIDDFRSVKKSYIKNHREVALELVSGADLLSKLMCGAGPVDLRGSRGRFRPPRPPKSTISGRPKNHISKTPGVPVSS